MKKFSLQRLATFVSSATAFLLMIIKLVVGIFSGSIAVLSSAIDSLLDFFVSVFNNIAVYYSEKDPDKKFNYGRGKIEALSSLLEGIVVTLSGIYIFYESIRKIVVKETIEYLGASLAIMVVSIILTLALVIFQKYVVKKTQDLVVKSDMLHYETDLLSNGGILIGLVVIEFTGFYHIDAIIGIMVSIYIIVVAWDLIKNGFLLLLDVALDKEEIKIIKYIIKSERGVKGHHYLKTRQSGNTKFVEIHLVFDDKISLAKAHDISDKVENKIKKINTIFERDVLIHMDTRDDS